MDVTGFLQAIGERYGLLPVYALIIAAGGVQAASLRRLLPMLGILFSVYVVMFKAFDLKRDLDVFGLAEGFGLSADVANAIAAAIFVLVIGFAAYGVKRLFVRSKT